MDQILIVEDDENINQLLFEALTKEGYFCEQAYSGTEAKRLLAGGQYALVLLDLMLPGMPGEEVLASLREEDQTPVIVLTAKDQLDDKVDLLKGGADDYVTKPFNIEEVLARVQVQMRRKSQEAPSQTLSYKDMVIHKDTFQIEIRGVELPKITKQEFAILELLLRHPKKVFSKEEIFEYAWDEVYMGETKTLDVHISNIRKKIKQVTNEGYIETVWGIGYRLQR
nr:response regulator transcription factor [uncultured Anaerostipes sp.]